MGKPLIGVILAFALAATVGPANSAPPDHQHRHVKAAEWLSFTPEQKVWWVRGFVEGAAAGTASTFYQFGITEPSQNAIAVQNALFSRCTAGRSSVELAAAFDKRLREHPEDLSEGIHALFLCTAVSAENCPEAATEKKVKPSLP